MGRVLDYSPRARQRRRHGIDAGIAAGGGNAVAIGLGALVGLWWESAGVAVGVAGIFVSMVLGIRWAWAKERQERRKRVAWWAGLTDEDPR